MRRAWRRRTLARLWAALLVGVGLHGALLSIFVATAAPGLRSATMLAAATPSAPTVTASAPTVQPRVATTGFLATTGAPIVGSGPAQSAAFGDANGDGYLDLLLGAASNANISYLYYNIAGAYLFSTTVGYPSTTPGAQQVAFAAVDARGAQHLTLATPTDALVFAENQPSVLVIRSTVPGKQIAWGDLEGDGDLDLAMAGNPDGIMVAINDPPGSFLPENLLAVTQMISPFTALAWGDVGGDHYQDLVAGVAGAPNQLFLNQHDGTLGAATPLADACNSGDTRGVALADADQDGRPDLAVANYNGPACILFNQGDWFAEPITLETSAPFTAIDWGDWDNDGTPELAAALDGQPARVYGAIPGGYAPLWVADETTAATAVRWGDIDNDGDLDLVSARRDGDALIYINHTVAPLHLNTPATAAAGQGLYVFAPRPGATKDAYAFSSSEVLPAGNQPVTVTYTIYDPLQLIHDPDANIVSAPMRLFEFIDSRSGAWRIATPAAGFSLTQTAGPPQANGAIPFAFTWNAIADGAVGADTRFRVTVFNPAGNPIVTNTAASAISPPFQVRGATCTWPSSPSVLINDQVVPQSSAYQSAVGASLTFLGMIGGGSGPMQFQWSFRRLDYPTNNLTPPIRAQRFTRNFSVDATYAVTLTVFSGNCPVPRETITHFRLVVGTGVEPASLKLYLPFISSVTSALERQALGQQVDTRSVLFVTGEETPTGLRLAWTPPPDGASITGYRVYRVARSHPTPVLVAQRTAANPTAYFPAVGDSLCDTLYFVTVVRGGDEGDAGAASYATAACP